MMKQEGPPVVNESAETPAVQMSGTEIRVLVSLLGRLGYSEQRGIEFLRAHGVAEELIASAGLPASGRG